MKFRISLALIFCAVVALAQTNYTPISNLGQTDNGGFDIAGNTIAAQSFTTGGAATYLSSVSLILDPVDNSGTLGSFCCSIYSDSGGSPGSKLVTLVGNSYPADYETYETYTFCNQSLLTLSANTTYWIVASSSGSTGYPNAFHIWSSTSSGTVDAGSTWTLGSAKFSNGSDWFSSFHLQFSISVSNPQPPAISIFQPIVLTYPTPGFPCVLQQNSDLATTNWVTATNAVQLATVNSNQTVFIVQPNGGQMFYRLNLQ